MQCKIMALTIRYLLKDFAEGWVAWVQVFEGVKTCNLGTHGGEKCNLAAQGVGNTV